MFTKEKAQGQTLIIVALALIVLISFVALAVDVGNLYAERRHMQNAADAAALAGAREICFGNPALAESTAIEYATVRNRGEGADVAFSGDGMAITVTVTETASTFFAGVIGFNESDVSAVAAAACGRANSGSGLWPVAFAKEAWVAMYNDGEGCGDEFIVWTDDKIIDCDIYNCDIDGDGVDDILAVGDRGWLDFSAPLRPFTDDCVQAGCGASEVACQILNDTGSFIELPTCIPGISGIKAGVANEVNARVGDTVRIPLFSGLGCSIESGQALCDNGKGPTFYVDAFGCVKVVAWEQNWEIVPIGGGKVEKGKAIRVTIDCDGCETTSGGTNGEPAEPWELRAVSLIQ